MVIATAGLGLLFLLGQWTDTDDAREAAETFLWSNAAVGEQVGGIAELRQFGRENFSYGRAGWSGTLYFEVVGQTGEAQVRVTVKRAGSGRWVIDSFNLLREPGSLFDWGESELEPS